MKQNMGVADRVIRIIIAIVIVVLMLTKTIAGALAIILGILAVIFLVTGIFGFCPLYVLLRVSTQRKKTNTIPPSQP